MHTHNNNNSSSATRRATKYYEFMGASENDFTRVHTFTCMASINKDNEDNVYINLFMLLHIKLNSGSISENHESYDGVVCTDINIWKAFVSFEITLTPSVWTKHTHMALRFVCVFDRLITCHIIPAFRRVPTPHCYWLTSAINYF